MPIHSEDDLDAMTQSPGEGQRIEIRGFGSGLNQSRRRPAKVETSRCVPEVRPRYRLARELREEGGPKIRAEAGGNGRRHRQGAAVLL
jgi:hypothetical protein